MRGITITLIKRTQTSVDALNRPVYTEEEISVDNVLVGQPSSDEIANTMSLYGKMAQYTLAIPKGDENVWEDTFVILPAPFSGKYKTIGYSTAGIDALIPLSWNKKVMVEKYG